MFDCPSSSHILRSSGHLLTYTYAFFQVERKVADSDDVKREADEEENDGVKPQVMPGLINSQSQLRRRPCGRPVMLCRLPIHLMSRGGGTPNNLQGSANSLQMAPEAMEIVEVQPEEQQHRKGRKRRSEAPSSTSKRTKKIKLESEEGEEEEDDDVHHADMKPDLGKIDVEGSISSKATSPY